jgi:hypothetical protein
MTVRNKTNGAPVVDGRFKFPTDVVEWVEQKFGYDTEACAERSRNYAMTLALRELMRIKG